MKKFLTLLALSLIVALGMVSFAACSCNGSEDQSIYTRNGNSISFGTYPQSDVTATMGGELSKYVQTLPSNGNNNGWISYNYYISNSNTKDFMWYKDVDVDNNGTKDYRAVYFTNYRPYDTGNSSSYTYQDDNGYRTGNVYWFKYEPIKWRVLSESDGKAIILANLILDCQEYNYTSENRTIDNETIYGNNYAYSSIRAWLNDNFYNTAFNEYEKAIINTIEVDNSARSTNPDNNATYWNSDVERYACENTYDKAWLLSVQEVTRAKYGFDTNPDNLDYNRRKSTTAYAQCQGLDSYKGIGTLLLLRSGSYVYNTEIGHRNPDYSWTYYNEGGVSLGLYHNVKELFGISPALQISLV